MRKTLRKQWRYIFFRIHSERNIDKISLERRLGEKFLRFFGELNFGDVAYKLVEFDERKMLGIVKIDRNYQNSAVVCMALISELDKIPIHIETIKVSGTLKAGRENVAWEKF